MASKITFLGTAGDIYTLSRQYRGSGGIIINVDDLQFHLDPGPGTLQKAKESNINLRENIAVLLSQCHVNHANDLNVLITAMTYNGLDKKGVVIAPKSVLQNTENSFPIITNFHKSCVERTITVEPGQKVGIENVEIHILPSKHSDEYAVGFKFFTPDFVLSYSGDTKYSSEIVDNYKGSDILILNTLLPSSEKSKQHLNTEDAIKIIQKVKPRLVIITHFGIKMLKADPLQEAREIQRQTDTQVIAAKDGLSITPKFYSAQSRQKTLLDVKKFEDKEVEITQNIEEEPLPLKKSTPQTTLIKEITVEEIPKEENIEEAEKSLDDQDQEISDDTTYT